MQGTIVGATKGDDGQLNLQIETKDGGSQDYQVPMAEGKKYPVGAEVTFGLRRVRKPRAKNGEGAATKKKKKNGNGE